ncbi:zinc finger CCCH domain-containing protein 11A [Oreochromis niloticus]|uniref:zinc finger CCCH domain-containing protein 11A n=1 Tax=Oreochromis niloticus TaxID=8128 RepID=UPI0003942DD0|nr:zinc finger CCCH domain-containing protein 11A [Oreochromis niloticus]XP_013122464.1 zinc finger CCCH domain-containing protein 11A [Oreochromis niloticus]
MTSHGDDCYFFYYSTCSKGDSCPFRHCEAAMGNETICSLWQEGRCFRAVCKFRHMKITKNRKEIPCYWENQPAGCQKPHCAFYHEKPRYIEGVFVQPDKNVKKEEEQHHEEQTVPAATVNPQLRSVKTETQEPVPSPTHPPVVINPADDDEDEDDQFSEEGEEGKGGPSPRKLPKSDDSLNFGVSTLEEIRLRKALKASMKRAGYPLQTTETSTNVEKENIQTFFRPDVFDSRDEPGGARVSVTKRLGRKINSTDLRSAEDVPLKRSLARRLGRVVDVDQPFLPPQKALKPVKERLGLLCDPVAPTQPSESSAVSQKVPELIHIKTLEEIKQEKAVRSQPDNQKNTRATEVTESKASSGTKRAIAMNDTSTCNVKTFSEILHNKKKRQEEELEQKPCAEVNHTAERDQGNSHEEADTAGPEVTNVGQIRVKTLEEIRMEKAARSQLKQAVDAENRKRSYTEESSAKKPRLLRIKKLAPQTSSITAEKTNKPHSPSPESQTSNNIKVKTFEEIMREKRLRKQEMLEQGKVGEPDTEPSQNQNASDTLKKKAPSSPCSSSPSSKTPRAGSTERVPVRKLITLRSTAASPGNSVAAPETTAAVVTVQSSSPQQAGTKSSSRVAPGKKTQVATALSPVKQPHVTGPSTAEETMDTNQKESPEHTADTKGRPKLNVKPSVMKPAVLVKPGQRRRGAEQSAVVAVKPLNSPSALSEEPQQEPRNSDRHTLPSTGVDTPRSSAAPHSHFTQLESGSSSSPTGEELQTVPVFKQSLGQEHSLLISGATTRESCTVPQSSVQKTPSQPRSRRLSTAASRAASTSAMDDFEELINEFTDDHLDGDVDPSIGEDDLLQELSEMIDS